MWIKATIYYRLLNVIKLGQMGKSFQPKYDPLQVFAGSKTPAGLYARQKWRHEESEESWASDFNDTVKALRTGQLANGSWSNSEVNTIQRLFGLHLTVREPDKSIELALDWLLSKNSLSCIPVMSQIPPEEIFYSLPFSNGCREHFVICAGLFLANCFGQGEARNVTSLYDRIADEIEAKDGNWCRLGCANNALRAFVVHKRYSRSRAASLMVHYLGCRQLASGRWKGKTPLYMTFNALAHLDSANARHQCITAAESIVKIQNKDGSWGRMQKEWNTFLVVHALNRLNA
jgi:hypothetical protein